MIPIRKASRLLVPGGLQLEASRPFLLETRADTLSSVLGYACFSIIPFFREQRGGKSALCCKA